MVGRRTALGEFEIIAKYFQPLTEGLDGALNLADDTAILPPKTGHERLVATDVLVEGVHFLPSDGAGEIARKALRVNLSDLAAMGGAPVGYTVGLCAPADVSEQWFADFAAGLAADQSRFGIGLLGGDTVRGPGPTMVSITAIGEVPAGQAICRAGAQQGDLIFVSGTIGDGWLGLEKLTADQNANRAEGPVGRYLLPEPRLELGRALRGLASAAIDVSDGLVADLGHICAASDVGARLELTAVPLSREARSFAGSDVTKLCRLITGGDDYELLFTVDKRHRVAISELSRNLGIALSEVGEICREAGVRVIGEDGQSIELDDPGFAHF